MPRCCDRRRCCRSPSPPPICPRSPPTMVSSPPRPKIVSLPAGVSTTPLPVPTGAAPRIVSATFAADQEVAVVGADQGPDVVVDDVLLLAADRPAGAGRPGLGEAGRGRRCAAIDDRDSALADGDVGEGVGAGVAEDLVVAEPGDDRVVARVAVDHRPVGCRGAAAADDACRCRRRRRSARGRRPPWCRCPRGRRSCRCPPACRRPRCRCPPGRPPGSCRRRCCRSGSRRCWSRSGSRMSSWMTSFSWPPIVPPVPVAPGSGSWTRTPALRLTIVESALADGDVGEGVGPAAAGQVVAADP